MDDLITPVITTLPFYRVNNDYMGSISCDNPFYFQKYQCERECPFGTITDMQHLPSFIVRVPKIFGVNATTDFDFKTIKLDGSGEEDIIVDYVTEAIDIITPQQKLQLQAQPPNNLDSYIVDLGSDEFEFIRWVSSASTWQETLPFKYDENDLIKLNSGVFCWVLDGDGLGSFKQTNNGFHLCDIGNETYFIYNGFKVDDMACGLRQISIKFDLPEITDEPTRFVSEVMDIRDFDIDNSPYHKLEITNDCNLGNIPYSDIYFNQHYYFENYTLVLAPEYSINDSKEEDGLGNEKLTFSKITKLFILDTFEVPEYISDYLFFSTQHNSIQITYPYEDCNKNNLTSQYVGKRKINRDTLEIRSDFDDEACYTQVEMKFSLQDDLIMTNCCQQLDKNGCILPSAEIIKFASCSDQEAIEASSLSVGDSYIINNVLNDLPVLCLNEWGSNNNKIAVWNGQGWSYQGGVADMLVMNLEDGKEYISIITGTEFQIGVGLVNIISWKEYNTVVCDSSTTSSITISSCVDSSTTSTVFFKQNLDILFTAFGNFSSSELASGVEITGLNSGGQYEVKIHTFNNNCDYGLTDIVTCSVMIAGSTDGEGSGGGVATS